MTAATVSRLAARLVLALVSVVLVACADGERASDSDPDSGHLVVQKSLTAGPISVEGSVTYLRIARADGKEVIDDVRPLKTLDVPIFDRPLPTGTYHVTAIERPCQGNCQYLDPPLDETRCQLEVDVRADQTTRITIALRTTSAGPRSDCSATTRR